MRLWVAFAALFLLVVSVNGAAIDAEADLKDVAEEEEKTNLVEDIEEQKRNMAEDEEQKNVAEEEHEEQKKEVEEEEHEEKKNVKEEEEEQKRSEGGQQEAGDALESLDGDKENDAEAVEKKDTQDVKKRQIQAVKPVLKPPQLPTRTFYSRWRWATNWSIFHLMYHPVWCPWGWGLVSFRLQRWGRTRWIRYCWRCRRLSKRNSSNHATPWRPAGNQRTERLREPPQQRVQCIFSGWIRYIYSVKYLNRHWRARPINYFVLQKSWLPLRDRYFYRCLTPSPWVKYCHRRWTPWRPRGNGDVVNLQQYNVNCWAWNNFMVHFELQTGPGIHRYFYICCRP